MSDVTHLGPYALDSIITGNARELSRAIPDESVDLIFTDPVYDRIDDYCWLAETAARVLKPGGSVLAFCAHHRVLTAGAAMLDSGLLPGPVLEHGLLPPYGRLFSHSVQCNTMPLLWLSKGHPQSQWQALKTVDFLEGDRQHKWGKNTARIRYRMVKFTEIDAVVFDPFSGGGSTLAVCKMLRRHYLAFEIDPDTAERARQRVLTTQAPLVFPEPEQLAMDV